MERSDGEGAHIESVVTWTRKDRDLKKRVKWNGKDTDHVIR